MIISPSMANLFAMCNILTAPIQVLADYHHITRCTGPGVNEN